MSEQKETKETNNRLYFIIGILTVASLVYHFIDTNHLEQTTLLFIGLPALIAVMVIRFTRTPKSEYGVVFKVITLFLLISGILLGEGVLCIIYAAPLFYGVAAILVFINKLLNRNNNKLKSLSIVPISFLLYQLVAFEPSDKLHEVSVEKPISKEVSIDSFLQEPKLKKLPAYFQIGFPKPVSIYHTGQQVGDSITINFQSSTKGIGSLIFQIKDKQEKKVVLKAISDDSHINHWLSWEEVEIALTIDSITAKTQLLSWSTTFKCNLAPDWYFIPLEKDAIHKSTDHLIDLYLQNTKD